MESPLISIIILEYCNFIDTVECCNSVMGSTYLNYNIIIVDNNSNDDTFSLLVKKYKKNHKIDIIQTSKNEGYGAGNNFGIKYALNKRVKPDYILILGNDTLILPNTLLNLYRKIQVSKLNGIVGPRIMLSEHPEIINSTGGNFHSFGFANDRDYGSYSFRRSNPNNDFFFLNGACLLFRVDVLKKVNFFDPHIFLYWDDVDICWRVRLLNYKIIIDLDTIIYHKLNISTGKSKNTLKLRNREFSWIYVLFKNLELSNFVIRVPIYMIQMISRLILTFPNFDFFIAIISAYYRFLRNISKYYYEHKTVQKFIRITEDNYILQFQSKTAILSTIHNLNTG